MVDPFHESDDHWIAYGDFVTSLLGMFLVCVVMLVAFVNPEMKKDSDEGERTPSGNVQVIAIWTPNCDVDLWVRAPGDSIVGYSNKAGKFFNLQRDDRGHSFEMLRFVHQENADTRGMPAGEYFVNLHMYENNTGVWPVPVDVVVTVANNMKDKADPKKVFKTTINLQKPGQEVTALRFKLDQEGNVVEGSVNNTYRRLRSGS